MFIRNGVSDISTRTDTNRKNRVRRGSLQTRLFVILILTGMIPMLTVNFILTRAYLRAEINSSVASMEAEARILVDQMTKSGYFQGNDDAVNNALLDQMAENWNGRIRIVDAGLRIIRDTYSRDEGMYLTADPVLAALRGGYVNHYDAASHTLYFTEPITSLDENASVIGVIVVNIDTTRIEAPIREQQRNAILLMVIFLVLITFASLILLHYTCKPLNTLALSINKASDGSYRKVNVPNYRETQRISDAFNRTLGRLQILDQSRQEFVSNVAHELKTPITSIRVLADSLMGMGEAPVELYQDFMKDISEEIDRESKIIDDLLSLSRLDNNAIPLNIARTNVNEKMELILKRLAPIAKVRNIELLFESFRPVMADIDDVKLTLAVTNLVENAIKYNKDDGWVKVSLNADYQFFYIKVSDSGVGIPEDALEHVFERFYRVDKARSRATGGTGLGLAISRGIVAMHHGEIKVYSKMGEGTTFVVRIPLHYIEED